MQNNTLIGGAAANDVAHANRPDAVFLPGAHRGGRPGLGLDVLSWPAVPAQLSCDQKIGPRGRARDCMAFYQRLDRAGLTSLAIHPTDFGTGFEAVLFGDLR